MTNKMAVLMLAATLVAPASGLWASAGDSTLQGANGTTTGTPHKGHKKHHHKKAPSTTPSNTSGAANPAGAK